jgi:hypothetical protein
MVQKLLLSVLLGVVGFAWAWLYDMADHHQGLYVFASLLVVSSLKCCSRRKGGDHA